MKSCINREFFLILAVFIMCGLIFYVPETIGAGIAEGNKVNALMQKIASVLSGIGVTVFTIAIMVSAYKIIFGGATFREVAPILIGGILFGSAGFLALLIAGKAG